MNLLNSSLRPFRYGYSFLELSLFRVFVMFAAWIVVGYILYSNGGAIAIANNIHAGIVSVIAAVISFFLSLIKWAVAAVILWAYLRSPPSDTSTITSTAYSDDPSNIHYTGHND